ncbi:unnamed protein product [Parajaminaea phylloscopi]
MAEAVGQSIGGCLMATINFSWFYNSRIGTDWACCDTCCRCHFCDDKGDLPEDEQPGARRRAQQLKVSQGVPSNDGQGEGEALPAYEASQPQQVAAMTIPAQTHTSS